MSVATFAVRPAACAPRYLTTGFPQEPPNAPYTLASGATDICMLEGGEILIPGVGGEANPRNNVIDGHGVYFSPDAGASWRFMGLGDAGQISRILIDPQDPNTVYVAALEPDTGKRIWRVEFEAKAALIHRGHHRGPGGAVRGHHRRRPGTRRRRASYSRAA